ncbi:MAG: rhomboid family intramembrane serine protease [Bacteroidota bacterium]
MNEYRRPSGFQVLPPVVKNLLILNVLIFLLTYVLDLKLGFDLNEYLGLHYVTSQAFLPVQFLSYMFLHGSITHILFNMFALWTFGTVLENTWGAKRFIIFYAVCGIGAAVTQTAVVGWDINNAQKAANKYYSEQTPDAFLVFVKDRDLIGEQGGGVVTRFWHYLTDYHPRQELVDFVDAWNGNKQDLGYQNEAKGFVDSYMKAKVNGVTVGASGAIYGLLLAFGMLFPNALLYLYFAIPIRAKYAVALFGLLELYAGAQNSGSDNVAHFAHLGGMIFGYFLIVSWKKKSFDRFDLNN